MESISQDTNEFIDRFGEKLNQLVPHEFIAKRQHQFLRQTKEELQEGEFVVISDFSENYLFVVQDAIQAYHWSNKQCTLHPFSIYYKAEGVLNTISLVAVAESLDHNIVSVYLFQTKLFDFLKEKFGIIKKIYFFSDGSAAQYKNKSNFYNLCEMKGKYGFDAEWHFFATHHGKSPCDALGGTIKRMATKASLQNRSILSAKDLYDFLNEEAKTTINTVYCTQKDHNQMERSLKTKYKNVKTIVGTQKYHAFIPRRAQFSMICKRFSLSQEHHNVSLC